MSSLEAALAVLAFLAISLTGTYRLARSEARVESTRDRLVREAHERAAAAAVQDDAAINAGCQRLRTAIRNEQQKGEAS